MAKIHDRLMKKANAGRIPLTGVFELSPLCNFSCKMCYVRRTAAQVSEAGGLRPLSFWLDAAQQAADAGCLLPLISGGEPFLYPGFRKLYEAMRRMGMQVSINTNGSLIDEETVAWLRERPPVRINITLYGGSREAYGRLCGNPGAFDRVMHAAQLLNEAGLNYHFNCSLTPDNEQDFDAILDAAKQCGRSIRMATYMFPPLRSAGVIGDYPDRFTPEKSAYYEVLLNYRQGTREEFLRGARKAESYVELTDEILRKAASGPPGEMRCMAGRSSFWLDWQGNLSRCGVNTLPKFSLDEHPFAEAWDRIVSATNEFRYCSVCENCPNRGLCFVCAAMVYNETGSFDERPIYICERTRYAAKWYRHFLEQLPEEDEPASSGKPTEQPGPECPVDEF